MLPIPTTWTPYPEEGTARPGGFEPADYIPGAKALLQHKGIAIEKLPGDTIGLKLALAVPADFFGKPITGAPGLGAIEVGD